MDTKMGIEGIKPLESIWIEWSPIARSGSFDLQVGFSDRSGSAQTVSLDFHVRP